MAASIDDFVRRLTRTQHKFTFIFTEDFFAIEGKTGVLTDRYMKIRHLVHMAHHHKGVKAGMGMPDKLGHSDIDTLFDVQVVIVHSLGCFTTTFRELAAEPYGSDAQVCGYGTEIVDAQKARFLVDTFFGEKRANHSKTINRMLSEHRDRQMILVAESPADLKRPSLEPIRNLRHRLATILISPTKGPIVDCQVMYIFQEGNSNTFSALLNNFCVKY